MLRPAQSRRFRPEAFFKPRSLLLVGPRTPLGQSVAANLSAFAGNVARAEPSSIAGHPPADLAILACEPGAVAACLAALGKAGTTAAICATPAPDLAEAARAANVQVLGPASFGVIVPALGLNASAAHLSPSAGRTALVSQSAALCRAVIDWAAPNGVGFSHVVGTGGNAHTGFSMVLDYLSRDPSTGAILLDIRTIRNRRAFLAAARAAARLRPVVAIRAGGRLHDSAGQSDAVFGAALRRAGILRVGTLSEFLGAAEVLSRARPPRTEQLAVVTNAIGPAHMAADAAVSLGLPLLELDAVARTVLNLHLPPGPGNPGIVWTGAEQPTRVAEAAAMLSGLPATGGVVAILSPTGQADAAAVAALAAAHPGLRVPLLACVLGETTGAGHRRALAEAGVPVFATPEAAVRAFHQLVQQRRARAAAAELPARRVLPLAPDQGSVTRILATARTAGRERLTRDEALAVLAAYGMRVRASEQASVVAEPGRNAELRVLMTDDPLFGPAIGFGLGSGTADLLGDIAYELPPLNLTLARALAARTRAGTILRRGRLAASLDAVADALVRVSQLVVDHPEIGALEINPLLAGDQGVVAGDAWVSLRPPGQAGAFAIAPYPAELAHPFDAGGRRVLVRPIRPEDAEAHAALFRRLSPEDIRYRFFSMVRDLPPEQVARMTQVDYNREMAFVAVDEASGETVGVCRVVREGGADQGEFAVVTDPAWKGRGVARHLMRCIAEWARGNGMGVIVGQVLAENAPMLAFMRRIGATIRRLPDEPEIVEAVIGTE